MTKSVILNALSHYEARALCMYIEVQNSGFLYGDAEKITVAGIKQFPDQTYSMSINSPDQFGIEMFAKELQGVRLLGHSALDPEKERVNTRRSTLPNLAEFAKVEYQSE